ncbi:MAG: FxSxx-COOH system tetratricopeptide repeat protein [Pseudonocardiaceae bacterium]
MDFFISHAGRDHAWAEWVAGHLVDKGYTVELDSWDWAVGDNFVAKMHSAVNAADRVIALFSPAYFEEPRYTTEEWTAALVKDDGGTHRLVPVQIEPCTLPPLLRPLLRVELFEVDEAEAVRRLLAAVRGPTRPAGWPVFPGQGRTGALTGRKQAGPRLPGVVPPVWNVGPRNPRFVGREGILAHLREQLNSGGAAVVQALYGMGGVGKTQIAIEYAHRYAGCYDLVWWVSAEDTDLLAEQYATLAVELELAAPQADTVSAVGALRGHLRRHDRWLLVLDNAESVGGLHAQLPAGSGHILITSRSPDWGELATGVQIDLLPRPESVKLINRSLRDVDIDKADADRLAEALDDLPLALAQASGFLAATGMPVERYLELLKTSAEELLGQNPPENHPVPLAVAIRVSTDRLAEVDPAALALVRIGAFLASEPIPTDLLTHPVVATGDDQPPELKALIETVTNPVAAYVSLQWVGSYGLARIVGRGLQLHRLTQTVLRDQLGTEDTAAYRTYAQALLVAADPGDEREPKCWPGWARILPHLLATDPATGSRPDLRELACRAAWYLGDRGESHPARNLAEHLHRQWKERLGPDDRHTLRAAYILGRLLLNVGPYPQARQLGEDTLARCRRVLGDDHPDTLQAAHTLATCLHVLGAFEQARQLNADTFARQRQVLGDSHTDVWRTAHSLADNLRELGDIEAAAQLRDDTLVHRRQVLGDDHPYTINATNALGRDLYALGQVEAARGLHEDGLIRIRRILGANHSWTLKCANYLAADLLALGEFEPARHLSADTLTRARRVLGDESYFTIDAANNLTAALHALGDREAALPLSEDTLRRARRVFGDDHPRTRSAADNLAATLRLPGETGPTPPGDPDSTDGPPREHRSPT